MDDKEKKAKSWAENEIDIACKKINKDFGEQSYDYACFQSALKAYKTLENDGHSGLSWNIITNILIRLMDRLPLTKITDEDFNGEDASQIKDGILQKNTSCSYMLAQGNPEVFSFWEELSYYSFFLFF